MHTHAPPLKQRKSNQAPKSLKKSSPTYHGLMTPQPEGKTFKSIGLLQMTAKSPTQGELKRMGTLEEEAKDLEKCIEEKGKQVTMIELKIFKLEKDINAKIKKVKTLEEELQQRQEDLAAFQIENFEADLTLNIAEKKLLSLESFTSKALTTKAEMKQRAVHELELKLKQSWSNILLIEKEKEGINCATAMADAIIRMFSDPELEVRSITELNSVCMKPQKLVENFLEANEAAIFGLFGNMGEGESLSGASPKANMGESIRNLIHNYFHGKSQSVGKNFQSLVSSKNGASYSVNMNTTPVVVVRNSNTSEPLDLGMGIRQRSTSDLMQPPPFTLKNTRNHSTNFNLEEETSAFMQGETTTMNESNLDQSYYLILENVFSLLDGLFQRIKSFTKEIYEDCSSSLGDTLLGHRLKQRSLDLEKKYNLAKIDLADIKGNRNKSTEDVCLFLEKITDFVKWEQDQLETDLEEA